MVVFQWGPLVAVAEHQTVAAIFPDEQDWEAEISEEEMVTWLRSTLKSSGAVGAKVSVRMAHLEAPGERGDRHVVQYWCVTDETAEGAAMARACSSVSATTT